MKGHCAMIWSSGLVWGNDRGRTPFVPIVPIRILASRHLRFTLSCPPVPVISYPAHTLLEHALQLIRYSMQRALYLSSENVLVTAQFKAYVCASFPSLSPVMFLLPAAVQQASQPILDLVPHSSHHNQHAHGV